MRALTRPQFILSSEATTTALLLLTPSPWSGWRTAADQFSCSGRTGFFPHPTSCANFMVCVHGQLYTMTCPAGLYYSPSLKLCDWPSSAGCGLSADSSDITTLSKCSLLCPPHVGYFQFPDWTDCRRYYICMSGRISGPVSCPSGLFYDFWRWTCAYERDVTCYNP